MPGLDSLQSRLNQTPMTKLRTSHILLEQLKDGQFAADYLNESIQDSDEGTQGRLLIALRRIVTAHGMKKITAKMNRSPKALYVSLSERGNPTFATFCLLLDALDLQLRFEAKIDHVQRKSSRKTTVHQ